MYEFYEHVRQFTPKSVLKDLKSSTKLIHLNSSAIILYRVEQPKDRLLELSNLCQYSAVRNEITHQDDLSKFDMMNFETL